MLKALLIGGGVAVIPVLVTFFLSRKKTKKWGAFVGNFINKWFYIGGKIVSVFLQQKIGEKAENAIESTIGDFLTAWRDTGNPLDKFIEGMDEDDKK